MSKLVDTAYATMEVSDVAVSGATANGCSVRGKLHVRIPGSKVKEIALAGLINAKNQLHAEVGAFKLTGVGLKLKVNKAQVFYTFGKAKEACADVSKRVCDTVSIGLPPTTVELASLNTRFGRFFKRNWGLMA